MTANFTQAYIKSAIEKNIPKGIDSLYHIDAQKEVYEIVLKLVCNKKEAKLSYINLLIQDYKSLLAAKFTLLN
jgi:hypothetical protein